MTFVTYGLNAVENENTKYVYCNLKSIEEHLQSSSVVHKLMGRELPRHLKADFATMTES